MRFSDLIRISLTNLWRRKLRTGLTVLGVLIGTTSIVVMLSLGIGQKEFILKSIGDSRELTDISVRAMYGGWEGPGGPSSGDSKQKKLNDESIKEIAALPHVRLVSPVLSVYVNAKKGVYEGGFRIQGLSRAMIDDLKLEYSEGGFPPESDYVEGKLPLVIGNRVNENFYNPKDTSQFYSYDPDNPVIHVDMYKEPVFVTFQQDYRGDNPNPPPAKKFLMQASGVIKPEDPSGWGRYSYDAITDIEPLKALLHRVYKGRAWPGQPQTKTGKSTGEIVYDEATVVCDDINATMDLVAEIKKLGFDANSSADYIQQMQKQAQRSQLMLGGIGAIALLVAAIGIANTMMMSIYERTKEIGVFKVLGCSLSNIRTLFLLESGFIGLIGGFIGVILSYGLSYGINTFSQSEQAGEVMGMMGGIAASGAKISIIPPYLGVLALLFGCLVGMVSGMIPAIRAMRLSALEAIRTQ